MAISRLSAGSSKRVQVRRVSGVLAAVFVVLGLTKLLQLELYQQLGVPAWSLVVVGAMELVFALLILKRSTRSYGAMGLTLVAAVSTTTLWITGVALPLLVVCVGLGFAAGWVLFRRRPVFQQVSRSL